MRPLSIDSLGPGMEELKAPVLKITTAWGFTLFTSAWQTFNTIPWDTIGKFFACIYTLCLIYEYLSKKLRKQFESVEVEDGTKQDLN